MSDRTDQDKMPRLIWLESKGCWIDPQAIAMLMSMANAQGHKVGTKTYNAHLHIETRAGTILKVPCIDVNGANQLRDTLGRLANYRHAKPKVSASVNWHGTPQPGDAGYEEFRDRQRERLHP
jgi:hypothetical protein